MKLIHTGWRVTVTPHGHLGAQLWLSLAIFGKHGHIFGRLEECEMAIMTYCTSLLQPDCDSNEIQPLAAVESIPELTLACSVLKKSHYH
jgi:hypothetical protein